MDSNFENEKVKLLFFYTHTQMDSFSIVLFVAIIKEIPNEVSGPEVKNVIEKKRKKKNRKERTKRQNMVCLYFTLQHNKRSPGWRFTSFWPLLSLRACWCWWVKLKSGQSFNRNEKYSPWRALVFFGAVEQARKKVEKKKRKGQRTTR